MGYQVFVYEGCYTSTKTGRIVDLAGRVLFGGQVFATKAAAELAWYDTSPERNDRMTIKAVSRAVSTEDAGVLAKTDDPK